MLIEEGSLADATIGNAANPPKSTSVADQRNMGGAGVFSTVMMTETGELKVLPHDVANFLNRRPQNGGEGALLFKRWNRTFFYDDITDKIMMLGTDGLPIYGAQFNQIIRKLNGKLVGIDDFEEVELP